MFANVPRLVHRHFGKLSLSSIPRDLGVPFFRRLLEMDPSSLRPASFADERPLLALNQRNGRQCSGLATGARFPVQEEPAGVAPEADGFLVRHLERRALDRILAERPEFLGERPSVGRDERRAPAW